jgi:hypothetical protein
MLYQRSKASRFGLKTRSWVAGSTFNAPRRSSLTVGRNIFRNIVSTRFAALGCMPRGHYGRPRLRGCGAVAVKPGFAEN